MNTFPLPRRAACLSILLGLLVCVAPLFLRLPGWVVVCFLATWLLRTAFLWRPSTLPSRWLVLFALAVPLTKLFLVPQALLGREGGISFLLVLSGFKLLETRSLRDWRLVLMLTFFLAVTPLLFDQSPTAALWLLLTLALLTTALAHVAGLPLGGSARQALQAFGLGLPLAMVLFVIMPRLPGPLWNLQQQDNTASSGLSNVMSPGSISQLILRGDPAFSAVFPSRPPKPSEMYWRVLVLDSFDGQAWRNGERIQADISTEVLGGESIEYVLTAKPQSERLPALDLPLNLPEGVSLGAGRVFRSGGPQQNERHVAARSATGAHLLEPLSALRRQYYLQLPDGNLQARALAAQWRSEARDERQWIQKALGYYREQGFRYTLTPPQLQSEIIDQFLFSTRQGFCEHYAASLAFLARAAGIPSRVIVGYQGGDYNPLGHFWQIRSSDAHAWVELWLANEQAWLRVDPTAAAMPGRVDGGVESALPATRPALPWLGGDVPAWLQSVRQAWGAAMFQWQQWVIGYDAERQRNLFARLGFGDQVSIAALLRAMPAGAMVASFPLLFWWWRRRGMVDPLRDGWSHLNQKLIKAGVRMLPSDGPVDVLKRAQRLPEDERQRLKQLIKRYVELRYRSAAVDEEQAKQWRHAVRRFRPKG